jgi:hypothetical protein
VIRQLGWSIEGIAEFRYSEVQLQDGGDRGAVTSGRGCISVALVIPKRLSGCCAECQSDSTKGGQKRKGSGQMDNDASY